MPRRPRQFAVLLVLLVGILGVFIPWVAPQAADHASMRPQSWAGGTPAARTGEVLSAIEPLPIDVPEAIAAKITGPTVVFYFSPTCGHCRAAMPDVTALQGRGGLTWLGVAAGSATQAQVAEFVATFGVTFDVVVDADRGFAAAVGARSTPSVYVFEPLAKPTEDSVPDAISDDSEATLEPSGNVQLTQVFAPFPRGAGPVLLLRSHLDTPFADFDGYQGELVCRSCHETEGLSMAITHHSVALYTLYTHDKHEDAECVGCHVTGMGEPGGYVLGDAGHPMQGVQCEACHGPSGPHDGAPTDARTTCEGCHNAEHSLAFSVEKGLPHIDHYAATGLSEAELRARLQAVADGTADKPLLAFPEGDTVGAAACKSCHKPQHKWARRDAHASAMATLEAEGKASDGACVACHATPRTVGPGAPHTEPDHFRTDEAVGCESCHGPGAAHVREPRADNIVGFGESCPVCVTEAVCTSCHTREWDKDWDLDTALKAISH